MLRRVIQCRIGFVSFGTVKLIGPAFHWMGIYMTTMSLRGAAAAIAMACGVAFATPAFANQTEDRAAAISACRTEVARQLGVEAESVRFDQSSTRGGRVDVRMQVRGTAADGRYACRYSRLNDSVEGVALGSQANAGDALTASTAGSN